MSIADEIREAHDSLLEAVDGLKTADLERPSTIGDWSIRDVILHIAMWNGEVVKQLSVWRSGGKADWAYVGNSANIGKFNKFWIGATSHLSTKKVIEMYNGVHNAMLADLASVSDSYLKKRGGFPKWLHEIVVSHTSHHVKKIEAYRKTIG